MLGSFIFPSFLPIWRNWKCLPLLSNTEQRLKMSMLHHNSNNIPTLHHKPREYNMKYRLYYTCQHKCIIINYLMDEIFHFGLQTPPPELDSDQFVCAHVRTICLQLILWRKKKQPNDRCDSHHDVQQLKPLCVSVSGTFHSGLRGPLSVLVEWNRAGSSSGL